MIEHFLNSLIPTITNLGVLSYWLVGLIFFSEALVFIGLIIPGAIISVILGALASRGVFHLGDLMFFAAAGFFLGDWLSFYLGRKGTGLFKDENRILKYAHLEKGEKFFNKHGAKSLLIGRFIGFMRPLTPFIAGLSKMKAWRFFILNTLGIVIWVTAHFFVGYFFGQALGLVRFWATRAERFMLFLIIFFILFYCLRWLIYKKGKDFWLIVVSLAASIWQAIMTNENIKNLIKKYPKFFNWLGKRFIVEKFSGLTLSFLSFLFLYFTSRLILLTYSVFGLKATLEIDNRIESLMHAYRSLVFLKIFFIVSLLGESTVIIALVIGFSLLLWLFRKRLYILPLWFISAGGATTAYLIKIAIARPRPIQAAYLETTPSFPSGHAMISVVIYGYLAYFFWRNLKSWNKKINALFTCLLLIILISFSRIYLGVHYLSDIYGGLLLGAIWLVIGIGLSEYYIYKNKPKPEVKTANKKLIKAKGNLLGREFMFLNLKIIAAVIIVLEILFFTGTAIYEIKNIRFTKYELPAGVITGDILESFNSLDLEKYSESLDGTEQLPLNFIISADSDQALIADFKTMGWYRPNLPNPKTLFGTLKATTLNKDYPRSPIAPAFWQNQVTDFAFEKPTEKNTARQRHNIKIWRTGFMTPNNKNIYIGAVSQDVGVKLLVAHKSDQNIDAEREFLFSEFNYYKLILSWSRNDFTPPVANNKKNPKPFYTDGKLYIVDLK